MGIRGVSASAIAATLVGCSFFADLEGFSGGTPSGPGDDAGAADSGAETTAAETGTPLPAPTDKYGAAVAADAPVAWFRFEEASGSVAADNGKLRADGSYSGAGVTLGVPGVAGSKAIRLDGTNGRVSLGHRLSFTDNSPFSLELWFRVDDADASVRRVLTNADPDDAIARNYQLYYTQDYFQFERVGPSTSTFLHAPTPPEGQWQHIVVTYGGSVAFFYIDGVEIDEGAVDSGSKEDTATSELMAGDEAPGWFNKTRGDLDEVAIYDKVLTPLAVKAHFDASK